MFNILSFNSIIIVISHTEESFQITSFMQIKISKIEYKEKSAQKGMFLIYFF